jgi:hypothetical protein
MATQESESYTDSAASPARTFGEPFPLHLHLPLFSWNCSFRSTYYFRRTRHGVTFGAPLPPSFAVIPSNPAIYGLHAPGRIFFGLAALTARVNDIPDDSRRFPTIPNANLCCKEIGKCVTRIKGSTNTFVFMHFADIS